MTAKEALETLAGRARANKLCSAPKKKGALVFWDKKDDEALAVLRETVEEQEKCSACQGCGTITTWRDGGTCGQIKLTEICARCQGTGKERKCPVYGPEISTGLIVCHGLSKCPILNPPKESPK